MNWSTFIIWIGVAYAVYYALVFLIDLLKGVKPGGVDQEEAIDVSGLYAQAGVPAEVVEDEDKELEETEEEAFELEVTSKKKVMPQTFDSVGRSLAPVHSVGMSLVELIAHTKREAIQATANIQY